MSVPPNRRMSLHCLFFMSTKHKNPGYQLKAIRDYLIGVI
ncbi:hypothetical protein D1BOALGB6SA_4047 [Olavius sp. associated proteobacterium Delta 1]|nr:hypothetical protein D1BOALGB6SA_4047 [Olavius sp. associated proteobacterium Delta 1]